MVNCGYCKDGVKKSITHVRNHAQAYYASKGKPAVEPVVPAGRYALEADGVTKFYVVDAPDSGFWKGKVFLSVLASDEKHGIKNPATKVAILAKIAKDVKGAMQLFGQKIGKCGACGRTLTDEESRAFGIGPVCRGRL